MRPKIDAVLTILLFGLRKEDKSVGGKKPFRARQKTNTKLLAASNATVHRKVTNIKPCHRLHLPTFLSRGLIEIEAITTLSPRLVRLAVPRVLLLVPRPLRRRRIA